MCGPCLPPALADLATTARSPAYCCCFACILHLLFRLHPSVCCPSGLRRAACPAWPFKRDTCRCRHWSCCPQGMMCPSCSRHLRRGRAAAAAPAAAFRARHGAPLAANPRREDVRGASSFMPAWGLCLAPPAPHQHSPGSWVRAPPTAPVGPHRSRRAAHQSRPDWAGPRLQVGAPRLAGPPQT